jgi:hypothetical protein
VDGRDSRIKWWWWIISWGKFGENKKENEGLVPIAGRLHPKLGGFSWQIVTADKETMDIIDGWDHGKKKSKCQLLRL